MPGFTTLAYTNKIRSPVQVAAQLQHPEIVRELIRKQADLEYVSNKGWSLLHYLFAKPNPASQELLYLLRGNDVSFDTVKDTSGWNALHRCAAWGRAEDIQLMVKLFGAQRHLDEHTNTGLAAIHLAASMGNISTLATLIRCKDVEKPSKLLDLPDSSGWTPLHHSIRNRRVETMHWLIRQGADHHVSTFPAADWFPEGFDDQVFLPKDVAKMEGKEMVKEYISALKEIRPDVTEYDDDIYWDSSESGMSSESSDDGETPAETALFQGRPVCVA